MAATGSSPTFSEVLPKHGLLHEESIRGPVLCKPKLMPLKSITLSKLEKMQREAQEEIRKQEAEQQLMERSDVLPPAEGFN
ncbi:hypothetical protein NP493_814g00003 [Ridgeia piscesae]|uniref:BBSome-interacting protein 1 n=1 Tax=Ridgeia piscesae TaxID=27915 RepID=A0AAD9KMU6_RIDPI|nr:hypothetical protein NP493_814g00003 [Ridgeia piscesae]